MTTLFKKASLATALAACALVSTNPAMARDRYGHHDGGDTAAIAIGAGILGLAIGAIAASSSHRDRRYDDRYDNRYYYGDGWYYRDGYYYDRRGHRYDRREWQRRHHDNRGDYRRGYDRGRDGDYYYRRGY